MLRAIRVHSNFAEYVPYTLFLIFLSETHGASLVFIHGMCLALMVGRISHAFGIGQIKEDFRYRVLGMSLTLTVIGLCSVYLLFAYLR